MNTRLFIPVLALGLIGVLGTPTVSRAATLGEARTLVVSEAPRDNAYYAGTDVRIAALMPADLTVAAGNLVVSSPVEGDALLAGGTVEVDKNVSGDLRAVGGHITILGDTAGDVAVAGGEVTVSGKAGTLAIAGGTIRVTGGSTNASSTVTIYGADVFLSGDYAGDVKVVASDRLTLGDNTKIHGALSYNAPMQADIPATATITGGATYIGSSSFLPTVKEAKTFAIAGIGVFFLVKVLAGMVVAGLIVGLFPALTGIMASRVLVRSLRRFVLAALLGFGVLVAGPILILFLAVSFVGIGLALMLGLLYGLLLIFAYAYAGTLAGAALMQRFTKSNVITWQTALIGTLVIYLIGIIPIVGKIVTFILVAACAGALVSTCFQFAFKRDAEDLDELTLDA
jgi:hypothetical protein